MTTPNFPAVAADIRDMQATEDRARRQLDEDAEFARSVCNQVVVSAVEVINQTIYLHTSADALAILHCVLRRMEYSSELDVAANELRYICAGLADDVVAIHNAPHERL